MSPFLFTVPLQHGQLIMDYSQKLKELEQERLRIQAEISSYPAPIPACDVYFNDLLEQRSRICEALVRLQQRPPTR